MMNQADYLNATSETERYRVLTTKYCSGVGVDIASAGDPVVPWAINFELPEAEFAYYNDGHKPLGPIQLSGTAEKLPFNNDSMDFVYSSHLLEDFLDWWPILTEWVRVLKHGGKLIVLVPDKILWNEQLARGQTPNCFHKHESYAGELSTYADKLGLEVIEDRLTNLFPTDYSILFVARRKTL
jgi:SAM-dependent methyltransferase